MDVLGDSDGNLEYGEGGKADEEGDSTAVEFGKGAPDDGTGGETLDNLVVVEWWKCGMIIYANTSQHKETRSQDHDLVGDAVELGGEHSGGAEDTAGEGQAEGHAGVEDGDGIFLRVGPILRVLGVVGAIPSDQVLSFLGLPPVDVALIDPIVILRAWLVLLDILLLSIVSHIGGGRRSSGGSVVGDVDWREAFGAGVGRIVHV